MEFPKELSKTSSFRALIDNNCVYVDKTDIIAKFAVKKVLLFSLDQEVLESHY